MELTPAALWLNQTFAGFDGWLLGALHTAQQGPLGPFFDAVALFLHYVGVGGAGLIALGVVLLFFRKTRKCGVGVLLALLLGLLVTNLTLKPLVARPRPYADAGGPFYEMWRAAGALLESDRSFPSGHTTAAMAAMTAVFWSFDKRYSAAAFLFAAAMGLSRCYLVVHYPSDVLGGLLVGFLAGTASYFLTKRLWKAAEKGE